MRRLVGVLLVVGTVLGPMSGCSHLVESRSIGRFTGALENQDLNGLRRATSESFQRKALRDPAAVEAMKLLELPEGKVTVADVEEIDDGRRRVTAEVGEGGRPVVFDLVRPAKGKGWVVDDLLLKQSRRGVTVTRSATELVDLLLSVHEFQLAWRNGGRDEVLSSTTDGLSAVLRKLPPVFLVRMTRRVVDPKDETFRGQPRASLDEGTAQVRYNGPEGETVLVLVQESGAWRVDDIILAAGSKRGRSESVRGLAGVVGVVTDFLDAYQGEDHDRLEKLTVPRFYQKSLALADIAQVPLPSSGLIDASAEVRLQSAFCDVILRSPEGLVRISLERDKVETPSEKPAGFQVSEVTLIDYNQEQERRLSAVFTAHARMRLFATALTERKLKALKHNATSDFKTRVWNQLDSVSLPELSLDEFQQAPRAVLGTVFQGPVTEITVNQGSIAATYILKEQKGVLLVDDILVPTRDRPGSLKSQLERLLPVIQFRLGISRGELERVQQNTSEDFNRLVWQQLQKIPQSVALLPRYLKRPVARVQIGQDGREEVELGDGRFGARLLLVSEAGHFMVDDVELIAGPDPVQRSWLKQTLRQEVARPRTRRQPLEPARPPAASAAPVKR